LKQRSFNAWIYFGLIGLLVFLVLRPINDFNAYSPISQSSNDVQNNVKLIIEEFGVNTDTLIYSVLRDQKLKLYKRLEDSLQDLKSPALLQKYGVPLSSWQVQLISTSEKTRPLLNEMNSGNYPLIELNDVGQVISFKKNDRYTSLFQAQSRNVITVSKDLIENLFGHNLENYTLEPLNESADIDSNEEIINIQSINETRPWEQDKIAEFRWKKKDKTSYGPIEIAIKYKQIWKASELDSTIVPIADFQSFSTIYVDAAIEEMPINQNFDGVLYFMVSLIVLSVLVFGVSIKQILKGMVEWKRGFIMLFLGIILIATWRIMYIFQSTITDEGSFMLITAAFNTLFFALIIGLYTALAYMAWDSLARQQKHSQLIQIDSIFRGNFFVKETGKSILYGYAVGGVTLGTLAVALAGFGTSYGQHDSQFGFTEATSILPFLTIPMNALGLAVFGFVGHIALSSAFVHQIIKNKWLKHVVSIVFIAYLCSGTGRFFSTPESFYVDFLIFIFVVGPVYLAYLQFGYITASVSWWSFALVLFAMPFFNTASSYSMIQFLLMMGFLLLPAIFAISAYYFGESIEKHQSYIPEYEEKISRQLRFEKEIEIARESQFELLPKNTPDLPEAMICGFFIPSFEVGGDYYDYFLKYEDNQEKPSSLAITVVDVSGKGMKAAIHAVHTSGLILSRFATDSPEKVLSVINPFIYSKTDKRTFITSVTAEYFFETKILKIANAGHCLPVLKRNGVAQFIETPAPKYPLGIRKQVDYQAIDLQLQSGDVILFYSDGLPEAQNTKGDRLGFDTVLEIMNESVSDTSSSSDICQQIKRKVQTFSSYQMVDDTTIVALKIN